MRTRTIHFSQRSVHVTYLHVLLRIEKFLEYPHCPTSHIFIYVESYNFGNDENYFGFGRNTSNFRLIWIMEPEGSSRIIVRLSLQVLLNVFQNNSDRNTQEEIKYSLKHQVK